MCTATLLRDNGLRVTNQRVLIYELLDKHRIHPTVDMLYTLVSQADDSIGIATVYKTIDIFKEHNIVREIKCDNTPSRYDINTSNHVHFECSVCGLFEDVFSIDLEKIISNNNCVNNHSIKNANLLLSGVCSNCI